MLDIGSEALREAFLAAGRPVKVKRGEVILRRGDLGDSLVIVQSGQAEVSIDDPLGQRSILGLFGPGSILGDIACLDGGERSADVAASVDMEIVVVPRSAVLKILAEDGEAAILVIASLCEKVRNASEVLEIRALTSARARLASAVLRLAGAEAEALERIRVSQRWLGDYCGLTRENVNRQLRSFSNEGIARFDGGEVVVLDRSRLQDAAFEA